MGTRTRAATTPIPAGLTTLSGFARAETTNRNRPRRELVVRAMIRVPDRSTIRPPATEGGQIRPVTTRRFPRRALRTRIHPARGHHLTDRMPSNPSGPGTYQGPEC